MWPTILPSGSTTNKLTDSSHLSVKSCRVGSLAQVIGMGNCYVFLGSDCGFSASS